MGDDEPIQPITTHQRIVFGEHVLCPACKGMRIDQPMSRAEEAMRKRWKKQHKEGADMPPRWACGRCNGEGIIGLND